MRDQDHVWSRNKKLCSKRKTIEYLKWVKLNYYKKYNYKSYVLQKDENLGTYVLTYATQRQITYKYSIVRDKMEKYVNRT